MVMAVIMAVVMVAGVASAKLLGIEANYEGNRPDIEYDSGGVVKYEPGSDLFTIIAWDKCYYYEPEPSPGASISNNVGFGIAIYVDENGDFLGGVSNYTYSWDPDTKDDDITTDYDMIEYVLNDFTLTVDGEDYKFQAGDIFLAADILAFGWEYDGTKYKFDFLFDTVTGKLVDYGLWPTFPLTGAYVHTDPTDNVLWGTTETFQEGLAKGDKMPTPEPATLLLLGTGLIGIAQLGRKKLRKK